MRIETQRPTVAEIDLGALRSNFRALRAVAVARRVDGGGQGRRLRAWRGDGRAHAARRRMPSFRRRHARRGARAARGRHSHARVPAGGLLRRAGRRDRRARSDAVRLRRADDRNPRSRGRVGGPKRFSDSPQDRQRRDAAGRDAGGHSRCDRGGSQRVGGAAGGRLHVARQRRRSEESDHRRATRRLQQGDRDAEERPG